MDGVLENSLYEKHNKSFAHLEDSSRQFLAAYCGNTIIRDNIFSVIKNYARKREIELEILRYPFKDDELWAFTFLKNGTIFVCINSDLEMCKQIFAAAHELYHIHCYAEDEDQNIIRNGSLLDSDTADESGKTTEDLEANAFAGLLLMPEQLLNEQISLYGIRKSTFELDDVLTLMDTFALPYKATVLRLYESHLISTETAKGLLSINAAQVLQRILLTGKAKRWQLDGHGQESFGSLWENFEYNVEHGLLAASREASDMAYISEIKKQYGMD